MACSAVGGCGAGALGNINQMGAASALGGATPTNDTRSVIEKVLELLKKLGFDGNGQGTAAMSPDDIKRLIESLKQLGPEAMKKVFQQNPGLTQSLTQALAQ